MERGFRSRFPSPRGRVALLGIAHSTIRASRRHIRCRRKHGKSVPKTIKTIGDLIKVRRYEKGLLQSQLAAKLRISPKVLQQWETDSRTPSAEQWQSLERYLQFDAWSPKPDFDA
jgi:ribosome-binding protein aMBF1 (putative translation factor)